MSDPDGAQELTPFGTALTSDGRLWICVFNHSLVVEMDLKTGEILNEVHVPAPNDVCIDPLDETVAYAAGGSQTTFCCCFTVTNATRGKIFKITKKSNGTASAGTLIRGLSTLAGIEKMDDELFSSVLYKMFKTKTESCLRSRVPVWRGPDDNDEVWLADNIQKFDKDTLVIPAYRTLGDTATCLFLGCRPISAIGNCAAQCLTCIAEGENCREAFRDPEVALEFSILDTDAPLRLFLLNKDGTAKHFSVDLVNARQIESVRGPCLVGSVARVLLSADFSLSGSAGLGKLRASFVAGQARLYKLPAASDYATAGHAVPRRRTSVSSLDISGSHGELDTKGTRQRELGRMQVL
eukprot:scaffold4635_cov267-Pinguiococcus_pyrenoidosus.AAC.23